MKTAKIVFTLFLINVFFALPHVVKAQDVLTISTEPCSGFNGWHFSFAHSSTAKLSISQFVLQVDTSPAGFPNVRFLGNDVQAPLSNSIWSTGGDVNLDNIFWCADQSGFILPGQKDSFWEFAIQPNPNNPTANIYGYPITINWTANWATENGQGDPCSVVTGVSSGSFTIEDFPWTGNCLDTVTGTSSTPGCDPLFNFTVFNKNSSQIPIDGMVFYTDEFAGTMRPSDIQAPSGWEIDSVTEGSVTFSAVGGAVINPGQSLSGFIIGLLADQNATSFSFPWVATSLGTIIDEDTVWNVPATVQPCSSENGSSDTVYITNNSKCIFDANLENFHSGSGGDTVSHLTTFIISTPTPGITLINPVLPNFNEYPWAKGWTDSGAGTNKITFYIPNKPLLYGQPGGINAPWGFSLDNNALDSPKEIINWETLDSGRIISSGSDTIVCSGPVFADKAVITISDGCEYRLVLTNTHTPQSSLEGVAIQIPVANGTIPFTKGTYSGPTGWIASDGSGTSIRFQASSSSDYLGLNDPDTFYFTISPTTQNTTLPLTIFTYQAGTDGQLTDSVINVTGCTPAVVCDTVTVSVDTGTCVATLSVLNRRTNATIDSVVVKPLGGWEIGSNPHTNIPWNMLPVDANRDSVIFVGQTSPEVSQAFFVPFNYGPNTNSFPVEVNSYAGGVVCSNTVTMTCASAAVTLVPAAGDDLALTVAPNPLNSRSDIGFTLGSFSNVNLMLVDILGRTQATLFSGTLSSGDHTLPLDASTLAPGTYYIRLEAEGQRVTKKIVVEH